MPRTARRFAALAACAVLASAGCNGSVSGQGATSDHSVEATASGDGRAPRIEPPAPAGPEGEILPAALASSGMKLPEGLGADAGREDLIAAARRALEERRLDEALSIVEVAILLHGADPEARELRARCHAAQGDDEAAREDFDACCRAGNADCCDR